MNSHCIARGAGPPAAVGYVWTLSRIGVPLSSDWSIPPWSSARATIARMVPGASRAAAAISRWGSPNRAVRATAWWRSCSASRRRRAARSTRASRSRESAVRACCCPRLLLSALFGPGDVGDRLSGCDSCGRCVRESLSQRPGVERILTGQRAQLLFGGGNDSVQLGCGRRFFGMHVRNSLWDKTRRPIDVNKYCPLCQRFALIDEIRCHRRSKL